MGVTYLFYNNDNEIVGYVTVAMGLLGKKERPYQLRGMIKHIFQPFGWED